MPKSPFLLVIVDNDAKQFSTVVTFDDRAINERVVEAQRTGRRVHCFTASGTAEDVDREYEGQGYTRVPAVV